MAKTDANRSPRKGLRMERIFSSEQHPYKEIEWEKRDVVQTNWKTGEVIFEQRGVEFPKFWSMNATTIVTSRYFRGNMNSENRETSLRQVIDRVVNKYVQTAKKEGYFATVKDANIFGDELTWLLLHQYFSFNSPVWFNVGTKSKQIVSACYILSVEDDMKSILNWYAEEGMIFKNGSGAGINLSEIRSSQENLANGGIASGPISFMRGADASAGAIKSGGSTRRAAKMVVLDINHPDVEEFIETKTKEEKKIRALRDAGFDMDLGGDDIVSVQYQNANNSVRVDDEFMEAVENDDIYNLTARTTGEVVKQVKATELFEKIAKAAWECADPGLQYDTTINKWHTNKNTDRIHASNPCSEYMSLDNSSCNLASLNLLKFLDSETGAFDVERFVKAIEVIITAMDISICFADAPTRKILETTKKYRQLGIGYANLGALLMACGLAYDSDDGRAFAAAITALLTGVSYKRSTEIAAIVGPYDGYQHNSEPHKEVMEMHKDACQTVITFHENDRNVLQKAKEVWDETIENGEIHGYRNAQASVLAPTGTIGFMMDCDTTGIEPDFSLVKFKKLVGGDSMQIVNQTVERALKSLGYTETQRKAISDYILEHNHVMDAPYLSEEHYNIFDTATGERSIAPMGHINMMAATQPFLSGAISKTVNLPENATVENIKQVYMEGWKLGLKAVAVYRDNCKVGQPLSSKKQDNEEVKVETKIEYRPVRTKLPRSRDARTTSFSVGGAESYMTVGKYDSGAPGELFIKIGKQGSTLAGIMDAFSIAVSIGLQFGVPLETYVRKFSSMKFEPNGMTNDKDIRMAQSILDYVFRKLALDYMDFEDRSELGIYSADERKHQVETGEFVPLDAEDEMRAFEQGSVVEKQTPIVKNENNESVSMSKVSSHDSDAPLCLKCGATTIRSGACHICPSCGETTGCS